MVVGPFQLGSYGLRTSSTSCGFTTQMYLPLTESLIVHFQSV